MSAPQTNIEKQKRRHWGPLVGMAMVTLFAVSLIVYWLGEEVVQSDPMSPEDVEALTEEGAATTGTSVQVIEPQAQPRPNESPIAPPTTRDAPSVFETPGSLTPESAAAGSLSPD